MSTGTNRERIEQNNTKLNEIKGKINTLPDVENILDVTDSSNITIEDNVLVIN